MRSSISKQMQKLKILLLCPCICGQMDHSSKKRGAGNWPLWYGFKIIDKCEDPYFYSFPRCHKRHLSHIWRLHCDLPCSCGISLVSAKTTSTKIPDDHRNPRQCWDVSSPGRIQELRNWAFPNYQYLQH